MLRISRLTDYAVVLCTELANTAELHAVSDLALSTQIPEPTVSKVLKRLTRAGVVVSQRGVHGGYRLARPAHEIGIDEVISAIEGPIAVTECADDEADSGCEYEPSCGVRSNWQRINAAVQGALAGITIADMAHPASLGLVSLSRSLEDAEARRLSVE